MPITEKVEKSKITYLDRKKKKKRNSQRTTVNFWYTSSQYSVYEHLVVLSINVQYKGRSMYRNISFKKD